jgi:hypothetical protein
MAIAAILVLLGLSALLAGVMVFRPAITIHPGGKIENDGLGLWVNPALCMPRRNQLLY